MGPQDAKPLDGGVHDPVPHRHVLPCTIRSGYCCPAIAEPTLCSAPACVRHATCPPRIPCGQDGRPLFAQPKGDEAWVLLLEKAMVGTITVVRKIPNLRISWFDW